MDEFIEKLDTLLGLSHDHVSFRRTGTGELELTWLRDPRERGHMRTEYQAIVDTDEELGDQIERMRETLVAANLLLQS